MQLKLHPVAVLMLIAVGAACRHSVPGPSPQVVSGFWKGHVVHTAARNVSDDCRPNHWIEVGDSQPVLVLLAQTPTTLRASIAYLEDKSVWDHEGPLDHTTVQLRWKPWGEMGSSGGPGCELRVDAWDIEGVINGNILTATATQSWIRESTRQTTIWESRLDLTRVRPTSDGDMAGVWRGVPVLASVVSTNECLRQAHPRWRYRSGALVLFIDAVQGASTRAFVVDFASSPGYGGNANPYHGNVSNGTFNFTSDQISLGTGIRECDPGGLQLDEEIITGDVRENRLLATIAQKWHVQDAETPMTVTYRTTFERVGK